MAECVHELTEEDFLNETADLVAPTGGTRFATFAESDLNRIGAYKDEKSTIKQTLWGVKILKGELRLYEFIEFNDRYHTL